MTKLEPLMTVDDLKKRMKIPLDNTSQDEYLEVTLEDVLDFVKRHCRSSFASGLPGGVKRAIVLLVRAVDESNVASQSLGDMSKSFFKGATYEQALELLEPFVGYTEEDSEASQFSGKKVKFVVASRYPKHK